MNRRGVLFSFIGGVVLFLLLLVGGVLWFGDFGRFFAVVNGQAVYFPLRQVDLGACEPDIETEAVFKMVNLATKEISVVGERSSCTCAFSEQIPITADSGKTIDLKIKVRLPKYESSYNQTVIFMVAEPNKLGMHPVRITATIPNPLPLPVAEKSTDNKPLSE
jgi:hypothetical protein